MRFSYLVKQLPKIENIELPGEASHFKMMADFRLEELKALQNKKTNPKKAAVLALFYPDKNQEARLVFILRKTYQGVHSNQIGFPGGKVEEADVDLKATALREAYEEIGVAVEKVSVLKRLSKVYIPPSNFEVTPFIGVCNDPINFVLQESEVAALVEVSIDDLLDDSKVFEQKLSTSYAKNILVPAYNLEGHTVWGATAMMISEIKVLLKKILS